MKLRTCTYERKVLTLYVIIYGRASEYPPETFSRIYATKPEVMSAMLEDQVQGRQLCRYLQFFSFCQAPYARSEPHAWNLQVPTYLDTVVKVLLNYVDLSLIQYRYFIQTSPPRFLYAKPVPVHQQKPINIQNQFERTRIPV